MSHDPSRRRGEHRCRRDRCDATRSFRSTSTSASSAPSRNSDGCGSMPSPSSATTALSCEWPAPCWTTPNASRPTRCGRAAETRFEIGFEQSAIGAAIADLEGFPSGSTRRCAPSSAGSRRVIVGRRWAEYTHPDDTAARPDGARPGWPPATTPTRTSGATSAPDGTVVWASAHVTLVRDESRGAPVLLRAVPGHHRAQADGARPGPPGAARLAHRPAEPGAAHRPTGARPGRLSGARARSSA